MSPHLRTMFEAAADDRDRPVGLDLAAIRKAGRRATWRQRLVVGGGGIGAAAVITTVALVLAPGGAGSGIQPAGPGRDGPSHSWEEVIQPLVDAIKFRGYDVPAEMGSMMGMGSASEVGSTDPIPSMTASTMPIVDAAATGALTVAEFTDISMVKDFVLGEVDMDPEQFGAEDGYEFTDQCAVLPVNIHRAEFAWETCEESSDGRQRVATGGDAYGEAIGVTLLRADGTGISVSLSTATFDRLTDGAPTDPTLEEMPLPADELLASAQRVLELGPSVFPTDESTDGVDTAPPPTATPSASELPPGSDPCADELPAGTVCESTGSETINADPLVDALIAVGIGTEEIGGTGSGTSSDDSDADSAQSTLFRLTDADGRTGSASIGIATSLEAAPLMNDTSIAWCAVTPTYARNFAWNLADEPSMPCADIYFEMSNPMVVVHDEGGADAIGATLIRADGSVISVSISQDPGMGGPGEVVGAPLAELPLDRAAILTLLRHLDDANPVP